MPAPKGNEFWKLRSKHGRNKLFATPELLWEAACEYFKWCIDNPLLETKAFNTSREGVKNHIIPKLRVYTLQGLCLYCDCSTSYFRTFKSTIKDENKDFLTIITRIEETIYKQKFEGATADMFNANIIARDLGLADKKEKTKQIESKDIDLSNASPEDLEVIARLTGVKK